jgi:pimeloyl-ACP methyl ester carboxylesterase
VLREPHSDALRCALNGVVGDHLAVSGNPLALSMQLRRDGAELPVERAALARRLSDAGGKVLLLVHGLCMNDRQWTRGGHDHGAALARDLGVTPVYLLYNTGRHVSENGRELAGLLEALVESWPVAVDELAIVAHSMGGLVARSACRAAGEAGHVWPRRLRQLVFLGTPHHGAPLERGGNWVDLLLGVSRYSAPLRRLGMLRSAGITDLRYGNVCDADWRGRDRFHRSGDCRTAVPLPVGVACHALAGTRDVLVPVASALGRHRDPARALQFPAAHTFVGTGLGHFDLLDDATVYERIRTALAPDSSVRSAGRRLRPGSPR